MPMNLKEPALLPGRPPPSSTVRGRHSPGGTERRRDRGTGQEASRVLSDALAGRPGAQLFRVSEERRICNKDMNRGAIYNQENWKQPKSPPQGLAWQIHRGGEGDAGLVTRGEGELGGDRSLVRGGSQI